MDFLPLCDLAMVSDTIYVVALAMVTCFALDEQSIRVFLPMGWHGGRENVMGFLGGLDSGYFKGYKCSFSRCSEGILRNSEGYE